VSKSYRDNRGTDRVATRNGSGGAVGGDAPSPHATTIQRHEELFGHADAAVESARPRARGATDALRRVLQARVRGHATELDIGDLEEPTKRIRCKTEAIMERSAIDQPSILPGLLLAAAAVLCAAVLLLRFL
jgi:hypothetical protein